MLQRFTKGRLLEGSWPSKNGHWHARNRGTVRFQEVLHQPQELGQPHSIKWLSCNSTWLTGWDKKSNEIQICRILEKCKPCRVRRDNAPSMGILLCPPLNRHSSKILQDVLSSSLREVTTAWWLSIWLCQDVSQVPLAFHTWAVLPFLSLFYEYNNSNPYLLFFFFLSIEQYPFHMIPRDLPIFANTLYLVIFY